MCLKDEPATIGADHGVSLAAIDFLAWIAAADNDGRRRARLPFDPFALARRHVMVDRLEYFFTKTNEPSIYRGREREAEPGTMRTGNLSTASRRWCS